MSIQMFINWIANYYTQKSTNMLFMVNLCQVTSQISISAIYSHKLRSDRNIIIVSHVFQPMPSWMTTSSWLWMARIRRFTRSLWTDPWWPPFPSLVWCIQWLWITILSINWCVEYEYLNWYLWNLQDSYPSLMYLTQIAEWLNVKTIHIFVMCVLPTLT